MKKIIFCVTNDLNHDQRMIRICSTLASEGFDIELVGRAKRRSKVLENKPFKQTRLNCYSEKGKFFYIEYNIRLFWFLLFNKFDIAGSIDLDTIVPVYLCSKLKNKKSSFDAHEYFEEVPEVTNRRFIKAIWRWVGKTFIPGMDACYTVGPKLSEIFSEKYHRSFHVIRNVPVKKEISTVQLPLVAQPYLLYQGALNEGRGIELMIEAMAQLPEFRLLLAGDGDLNEVLREKTVQAGLEKRIIFLGNVSPANLEGYTAGAYAGLNLLENKGLSYYYSLANKFFDYVQFGVPVVTMDFPEYRALNSESEVAILLKNLDLESLVFVLKNLYQDINLHQRLRLNCLATSNAWNWTLEKDQLIQIYRELCK